MNISLVKEMNVSLVKEMLNNVSLRKLIVCFIMRGNVPMNKVLVIYSIIQISGLSNVFLARLFLDGDLSWLHIKLLSTILCYDECQH